MNSGVVVHQLLTTFPIEMTYDVRFRCEGPVGVVHNDVADFLRIKDLDLDITLYEVSMIAFLSTALRVKQR